MIFEISWIHALCLCLPLASFRFFQIAFEIVSLMSVLILQNAHEYNTAATFKNITFLLLLYIGFLVEPARTKHITCPYKFLIFQIRFSELLRLFFIFVNLFPSSPTTFNSITKTFCMSLCRARRASWARWSTRNPKTKSHYWTNFDKLFRAEIFPK